MNLATELFLIPGVAGELVTSEAQVAWGTQFRRPIVQPQLILSSAVDAGNTPTTILRPGLLMGQVTSTSKWKQWTPTAVDGSEHIKGVLMYDQQMLNPSSAVDRWVGWIMMGGLLKASQLIIPGNASRGINGDALELHVRYALTQSGRFMLDDEPQGNTFGGWQRVVLASVADLSDGANDGAYTVLEKDNNTLFLVDEAASFTLPTMRAGFRVGFYNIADVDLTVASAPADTMIVFNDIAADSVALSTANEKVGGMFEFIGITGGKCVCIPHLWADVGGATQTVTVAT